MPYQITVGFRGVCRAEINGLEHGGRFSATVTRYKQPLKKNAAATLMASANLPTPGQQKISVNDMQIC